MRNENSFGTKTLKFILLLLLFGGLSLLVTPVIFGIFGPMVRAIPIQTPANFILADFMGILTLVVLALLSLYYAIKFGWR